MTEHRVDAVKVCRKCLSEKHVEDFPPNRRTCRECVNAYSREWAKNNPEKRKSSVNRYKSKPGYSDLARKQSRKYIRENPVKFRESLRRYKAKHPERVRMTKKHSHIKSTYGLSIDDYESMYNFQGGVCAICGGVNADGRALGVDHNHKTGAVRALLCNRCNSGIGFLDDDPDLLERAAMYLRRFTGVG